MKKSPLSRRDFLKISWTSLWGLILAACKIDTEEIPTTTPMPTATDTPVPEIQKDSAPEVKEEPTATNTPTEIPTETPIPCLKLLTPENETLLPEIGKVTFSWEAMPGADKYLLELTLPNGTIVPFKTQLTYRDQYIEAITLGGNFTWQVTAYDASGVVICTSDKLGFEKPEYIPPKGSNGGGDANDGDDGASSHGANTFTSSSDQ